MNGILNVSQYTLYLSYLDQLDCGMDRSAKITTMEKLLANDFYRGYQKNSDNATDKVEEISNILISLYLRDEAIKIIDNEEEIRAYVRKKEAENAQKREAYLRSLTPVDMDTFLKEFVILVQKYIDVQNRMVKKNIVYTSLKLDLNKVLDDAKNAKSDLVLAEILDKAKKTIQDMSMIEKIVLDNDEIKEEIKKFKKQKDVPVGKKFSLMDAFVKKR